MKTYVERKGPHVKSTHNKGIQIEGARRENNALTPYSPLRKLKKILVPIDFSAPSLKALRYAVPFAEQFGATISLVHVREPVTCPPDFPNASSIPFAAMQEDEARKRLYELGYREIEELVPIDVHIASGLPADEIVNLARGLQTDLVIIATHGYRGLMHLVMGSTAEKVVRNAPCPVLVVREEEHEFV